MNKYLLIGGTGVMGHYVARQLVEMGNIPVVMTVSGNTTFISDIINEIELIKGDIANYENLKNVVSKYAITHIVHLGAILDTEADQNPRRAIHTGVEGMINVMEAARSQNVQRVVFTSSKGIYGRIQGEYWHPKYKPVPESYPTDANALNMYGIVKLAAENLGLWYQRQFGIEFIALRFASTVGPGKLIRHGLFVHHSNMIENAMANKPTHIPMGADAVHDPIYNADSARGIISALTVPKPNSSVFNIGPGYGITLQEFADAVVQVHPTADIIIGPGHSYTPSKVPPVNYILDTSKARNELYFETTYNTIDMIKDYELTMEKLGIKPTIN